jgi:uncharacterized protein DUF3131
MVSRRTVTFGGLSLPLLGGVSIARNHGALTDARPLIVVLSGIEPGTTFERLSSLCDPFLDQDICVTLGLTLTEGEYGGFSNLVDDLRHAADEYPELIELAIDAGEMLSAEPYRQLRQASTLQAQFTKAINPVEDVSVQPLLMAMTLLTSSPAREVADLGNMRAAGIRTVIHLKPQFGDERDRDPGYWQTDTGLRHAFVSATAPAPGALPAPALDAAIDGFVTKSGPVIYNIPLSFTGTMSEAELRAYGQESAARIRAGLKSRFLRSELPHTVYTQSQHAAHRYIIVRVDDYRLNPNDSSAHLEITNKIRELGIAMTEAVIPGGAIAIGDDAAAKARLTSLGMTEGYEAAAHGLDHTPREMEGNTVEADMQIVRESLRAIDDADGSLPSTFIPPNNAVDANALIALSRCGVANFSSDQGEFDWIWGLDKYGLMHASNIFHPEKRWDNGIPMFTADELLRQLGDRNDAVFMIHPATLTTAERRQDCFDMLERLRRQPGTELSTLANHVSKVAKPMPMLQAVRKARNMVEVIDNRESGFVAPAQSDLMADAAVAWQYFEAWQKKYDTVVPATGWRNGKSLEAYPFLTMWDAATLIMAYVSAHRIGLIDDGRFEKAVRTSVKFLARATFKFKKSALPVAEMPIGRDRGQRKGFDSTDTGRLLIALRILDNQTNGSLGIQKLVEGWNLRGAIAEGVLHNVSKGRLDSNQANSYIHYAARGYQLWDIEVNPAYRERNPLESMDATLRFLDEVRTTGRIATEPNVTETIEIGESEHGKVISDMLLAAQIERHEQTGKLTCVSEGPVDIRPWFTYPAYQLREDGTGEWPVDGPPGGKKYLTAQAIEKMRAISTKGCFLWLAARPGSYSSKLYALAREQGKTDGLGFASGILEQTLKRTDHSDINTNGIILEALAFMLTGRRPLLDTGGQGQLKIGALTQVR